MCRRAVGPSTVSTTRPRTSDQSHGLSLEWISTVTRGSRATFFARCRCGSVFTRMCSPSVSTHVSKACGCPLGMRVTTVARLAPFAKRTVSSSRVMPSFCQIDDVSTIRQGRSAGVHAARRRSRKRLERAEIRDLPGGRGLHDDGHAEVEEVEGLGDLPGLAGGRTSRWFWARGLWNCRRRAAPWPSTHRSTGKVLVPRAVSRACDLRRRHAVAWRRLCRSRRSAR